MIKYSITREKFNTILPILESARKKTKPRQVDLYDVFNGIIYSIKEGCTWRQIPNEYPNWKMLYKYFTIWKKSGVLDEVLKKIDYQGKTGAK